VVENYQRETEAIAHEHVGINTLSERIWWKSQSIGRLVRTVVRSLWPEGQLGSIAHINATTKFKGVKSENNAQDQKGQFGRKHEKESIATTMDAVGFVGNLCLNVGQVIILTKKMLIQRQNGLSPYAQRVIIGSTRLRFLLTRMVDCFAMEKHLIY
jgi:hypothetical protein